MIPVGMRAVYSALASCALLSATVHAADINYKILDRIKMPDGGFDYATFDSATSRVYMTRTKATDVIDVRTGKVSELSSTGNAHLAVPVPGTTLIVLALGQESLARIVDTATDRWWPIYRPARGRTPPPTSPSPSLSSS
jgi:hypothetical protein